MAFFLVGGLLAVAFTVFVFVLWRSQKQPDAGSASLEMPEPPEITFLEPSAANYETFEGSQYVKFEVKTLSPLKKLAFFVNDVSFNPRLPDSHNLPNIYEVLNAELRPGTNHLRVEAANLSAEAEKQFEVKRHAIPLRTRFVSEIPKLVPTSHLTLRGHFTIERAAINEELRSRGFDRFWPDFKPTVYVNGFCQAPVKMNFPAEDDRWSEFEAEIVLNQAKGNRIHFRFPQVYLPFNFVVDCANPQKTRNLYLLIAAPGMKDGEKFTDRVLKAFQAHKGKDVLSSKIFERIYAFSLTSQFTTKQFYQHLSEINNLIKKRGSPNDIVIVYFGGQEIVDGQGHFFFLPEGKDDPELMRSCVTIDALWAYFDELMGAKLLLLDVARRPEPLGLAPGEAVDRISRMSLSNKSIGVMRFLWRQAVPVPGCILALEQETNSTQKTSLSDLETSGGRLFKQDQYAEFGVFEAHFPEELRSLILKEQP